MVYFSTALKLGFDAVLSKNTSFDGEMMCATIFPVLYSVPSPGGNDVARNE
jgi:hypothetical protein